MTGAINHLHAKIEGIVHHSRKLQHHEDALNMLEDKPYSLGMFAGAAYHGAWKWYHNLQKRDHETIYG